MPRLMHAAAVAAAVVLCGCSQKDAAKPDSSKVAQSGAPAAGANAGSFDPATRTLTVHAADFSFQLPDTITAGWTNIHLVNDGTQLHHVQLARLDSGKTLQDLTAALKNPGPPPRWMVLAGGANAPDPHATSDATVNLAPGNYAVICMVDLGDGIPHFAKGMVHPLTVTASTTPGTEPTADATIALNDYSFTVEGALTAGKHTIKVVNKGPQPHEIEIIRLADGKTMKDVAAWVAKPNGPPPMSAIGGAPGLTPTGSQYFTVDFTPGNYAFLCFLPDAKDGKPHLEHGMVKEVKIS